MKNYADRNNAIFCERLIGGDSLAAIGRRHGITREHVRQIFAKRLRAIGRERYVRETGRDPLTWWSSDHYRRFWAPWRS